MSDFSDMKIPKAIKTLNQNADRKSCKTCSFPILRSWYRSSTYFLSLGIAQQNALFENRLSMFFFLIDDKLLSYMIYFSLHCIINAYINRLRYIPLFLSIISLEANQKTHRWNMPCKECYQKSISFCNPRMRNF